MHGKRIKNYTKDTLVLLEFIECKYLEPKLRLKHKEEDKACYYKFLKFSGIKVAKYYKISMATNFIGIW